MGKQKGGVARFIGSVVGITGYVDDGQFLWRKRTWLDKKKWKKLPSMARQRACATAFSAASVLAAEVWGRLPKGMRMLSDGMGYNALVGRMVEAGFSEIEPEVLGLAPRVIMTAKGYPVVQERPRKMQLVDAEAVFAHDKWALEERGLYRIAGGVVRRGEDLLVNVRIAGLGEVFEALREGFVGTVPVKERQFVTANRYICDGIVRETVDWEKLGTCERWRRRTKLARARRGRGLAAPDGSGFRVRVWVRAVELRLVERNPSALRWEQEDGYARSFGGVLDLGEGKWRGESPAETNTVLQGEWVDGELVVRGELSRMCMVSGKEIPVAEDMVVFVGLDVQQKEGRNWARRKGACGVWGIGVVEESVSGSVRAEGRRQAPLRGAVRGRWRVLWRMGVGVGNPAGIGMVGPLVGGLSRMGCVLDGGP